MYTIFGVKGGQKPFKEVELEAWLDEDPYQLQNTLNTALGTTSEAMSKRFHELGMNNKEGSLVPNDLTPRDASVFLLA